ncbi:MAG: four helix bundle protein [Chloroflexi bacterium]|nr:four helix bundle protein [Chloroflexota bacterium]
MSKVTRFEELIAWQKARQLAKDVYMVSQSGKFASDFGLRDQIQRAVVSIMANIAEGFERNRAGEFHQFLSIAKASCAEVRSHLYIAFDIGDIEQAKFEMLLTQAEEVGRVIGGLRSAVSRTRDS